MFGSSWRMRAWRGASRLYAPAPPGQRTPVSIQAACPRATGRKYPDVRRSAGQLGRGVPGREVGEARHRLLHRRVAEALATALSLAPEHARARELSDRRRK